jgi:hypothetical protein
LLVGDHVTPLLEVLCDSRRGVGTVGCYAELRICHETRAKAKYL